MLKPMIPPPTTRKSHFSSGPSVDTRCSRVSVRVGLQRGTNTELTLLRSSRQTPCHSAAAPPQQLTSSNTKRPHTMQALERCHLCSKQQSSTARARMRKLLAPEAASGICNGHDDGWRVCKNWFSVDYSVTQHCNSRHYA